MAEESKQTAGSSGEEEEEESNEFLPGFETLADYSKVRQH